MRDGRETVEEVLHESRADRGRGDARNDEQEQRNAVLADGPTCFRLDGQRCGGQPACTIPFDSDRSIDGNVSTRLVEGRCFWKCPLGIAQLLHPCLGS